MENWERQEERKGAKKEEGKKSEGIQTAELDRRDQVTATESWPSSLRKREQRSIIRSQHLLNRVHPTCTERQSLNKECRWKGDDRGGLAQWEQIGKRRNKEKEKSKKKA